MYCRLLQPPTRIPDVRRAAAGVFLLFGMGVTSFGQAFKPYLVEIAKTLLVWLTTWAGLVSYLKTSFGDAHPFVAGIDTALWYEQRHPMLPVTCFMTVVVLFL